MKSSEFLRFAAFCLGSGIPIENRIDRPKDWVKWICLTLPDADKWNEEEVVDTRIDRFLLAATIAEGEGD